MEWDSYAPFDPGIAGPLHLVSKAEARAAFERLMHAKDERIDELSRLLAVNGIELTNDAATIQQVNDFVCDHIAGDPDAPGRLAPMWYAVVNDVALYLGDLILRDHPHLNWVLFDGGRKDVSYQRHVITGFRGVANPKYNVDVDLLVATYGHQLIKGQAVPEDYFARLLEAAAAKA